MTLRAVLSLLAYEVRWGRLTLADLAGADARVAGVVRRMGEREERVAVREAEWWAERLSLNCHFRRLPRWS